MKIEALFFASARDAVGTASRTLEVDAGARVRDVFELLVSAHPGLNAARGSLRFAVNEDFVDADHELAEGDCVALLPPVSGG
jgi:molybdopterin converting factor subunit 1